MHKKKISPHATFSFQRIRHYVSDFINIYTTRSTLTPSFYEFRRETEKSFFSLIKQKAGEKNVYLKMKKKKKIKTSSSEVCLRELKSC